MGIAGSYFPLAQSVALAGGIGIVSGVCIHVVIAWLLQLGDPGGHIRRAAHNFPYPDIAEEIFKTYYIEGGKQPDVPFKTVPFFTIRPSRSLLRLNFFANFAVVWLAMDPQGARDSEGNEIQRNEMMVGINYLEKVQLPHLSSAYGAITAGVKCFAVGAGIASQFPSMLDALSRHQPTQYRLTVKGALPGEVFQTEFDPRMLGIDPPREALPRPDFYPIVSTAKLGERFLGRSLNKGVNGAILENPEAAGHNPPPRVEKYNDRGEPEYGPADAYGDLSFFTKNDVPFWLAGGLASPTGLAKARALGARGIQVGSIFALCEDSGLDPVHTAEMRRRGREGTLDVFTDPVASPSTFPFKVAGLPGTLYEQAVYREREAFCGIGALQETYRKPNGEVGYRCSAADPAIYAAKGGTNQTDGAKCLCAHLLAAAKLVQIRQKKGGGTYKERPIFTLGDHLEFLQDLPEPYTALQAMQYLLSTPV